MDRRNFLKTGFTVVAGSLLPIRIALGDEAIPDVGAAADSVLRAGADSLGAGRPEPIVWEIEGEPAKTVKALFSVLGDLKEVIGKEPGEATVLIKPNLCLPHPSGMGTTTSPDLVDELCSHLFAGGVKRVVVADHTLQQAKNFEKSEMVRIVAGYKDAKMILANEERWFEPVEVDGKVLKQTDVFKMLPRVDFFINVATAKHHSATSVSLATKNLMGLIWDRSAFHTKMDLHQAIGDLALTVRPDLSIIDAGRVLLNGGPTGPGPIKKDSRIFAGTDVVALDTIVTSRYNFGGRSVVPGEVRHLLAAHENGVGEIDIAKIKVVQVEA
jgi:uncharacterized protein (DUF362 family)